MAQFAADLYDREVPKSWRLGSKPNLKPMHSDACDRIQPELVEAKLLKTIEEIKNLTAGTSGAGYKVKVHLLPDKPSDVGDDGEFHFAVLGPKAASSSGNPSAEARRFVTHDSLDILWRDSLDILWTGEADCLSGSLDRALRRRK
jgi:hypothetical protein